MDELIKDLQETVDYLYDAGRSDLVISVLEGIQKIRAAEEMALAVVASVDVDRDLWLSMKAYRNAGSVAKNTQKATPA